jgi:hypothetical protein
MTGLDLAELKRLEAAATPGPWFIHDFSGLEGIEQPKARDVTISCDHPATITVAEMGGGLDGHKGVSQGQYDAALIAALRNAAPALIAAAEERGALRSRLDVKQTICGACGELWTGEKCGQQHNLHSFPTCYPHQTQDGTDEQSALTAANAQIAEMMKMVQDGQSELMDYAVRLRKSEAENTRLRAALATSKDPCVYCSLPADEMAKCASGFPGCGRADDLMGCPELGASLQLRDANARIAELEAALKPFANLRCMTEASDEGEAWDTPDMPDSVGFEITLATTADGACDLTLGQFRRARAVLASKPGADGETGNERRARRCCRRKRPWPIRQSGNVRQS